MTLPQDYADTARQLEAMFTDGLETWKSNLDFFAAPVQAFPSPGTFSRFDAAEAVDLQFQFIKDVVDVNYEYARELAEATNTVTGAVRNHIEGLSTAVFAHAQGVAEATYSAVDTFEESVRVTTQEVERLQTEALAQAEKVAREQYRSLIKSPLAAEAARRSLPMTGTIDKLVDRPVEDDTTK